MRVEGWELRLQQVIEGRREALFSWGAHDCCQVALAAYEACTGHRPAVPAYSTERGAWRVLRRLGGLRGAVAAVATPLSAPALAQRGDIVLVEQPGLFGHALAVCAGGVVLAAGQRGLVRVPAERWHAAWRV